MNKKNLLRVKSLLLLSSSIITVSLNSSSRKHIDPAYQFTEIDEDHAVISYANGCAYFGDPEYLATCYNLNDDAIFIYDERTGTNPNVMIFESYLINNLDDQEAILKALLEYESIYPTEWDRTFESMQVEWIIHNILFDLYIKRESTGNVDLDNEDQRKYTLLLK